MPVNNWMTFVQIEFTSNKELYRDCVYRERTHTPVAQKEMVILAQ